MPSVQCVTVIIVLSIVPFYCSLIRRDVGALDYSGKSSHVLINSEKNLDKRNGNNISDVIENSLKFTTESKDLNSNITDLIATPRLGDGGGGGKGKGGKKGGGFLQKVLPFMVIPFMVSSSIIPVALTMLKFMLLKSAFIGKMGIILLLINMFIRFNNQGGVYSHNINLSPFEKDVAMSHYGYNGNAEYGAYIHRRKR